MTLIANTKHILFIVSTFSSPSWNTKKGDKGMLHILCILRFAKRHISGDKAKSKSEQTSL